MGVRVLIVDDHPSFRAAAKKLLEVEGFEVIGEAPDGTSAIEAVQALHPDLVLLDVGLPDLDGFEVSRRLQRAANGNGAPCVVLTSSRDWSDYGQALAASGARGFVPKAELSGAGLEAALAA